MLYLPGVQKSHLEEPAEEAYWPLSQSVQAVSPMPLEDPAGQALQDERSEFGALPAAQYVQVDEPVSEIAPSAQLAHVELVPSPDLPASHEVQAASVVVVHADVMCLPAPQAEHGVQDTSPSPAWKLSPLGHASQESMDPVL